MQGTKQHRLAAAIMTGVMPISSLLCAFEVLGEPILWWHFLGIGGVYAGTPSWPGNEHNLKERS